MTDAPLAASPFFDADDLAYALEHVGKVITLGSTAACAASCTGTSGFRKPACSR